MSKPPGSLPRHDDPTELEPRPAPPAPPGEGSTSAQLRRDIESGQTGDKVAVIDPAAAPLGTDDEAAGASPDPGEIHAARARERSPALSTHPDGAPARRRASGAWRVLLGLFCIVVLAAVLAFFTLPGRP